MFDTDCSPHPTISEPNVAKQQTREDDVWVKAVRVWVKILRGFEETEEPQPCVCVCVYFEGFY